MTKHSSSFALGALASVALPSTAIAAPVSPIAPQPVLRGWLNDQFIALGKSCLSDNFKLKKSALAIPKPVQNWAAIQSFLEKPVKVFPTETIASVFSETFILDSSSRATTPYGSKLPVPWSPLLAPTMNAQMSDARLIQNCSSFIAGNADLAVKIPILQAALSASLQDDTKQTNYIFAGSMISPFAWAVDKSDGYVVQGTGVPRATVLMALWNWYRVNPGAAIRNDVVIRQMVQAVSVYSLTGVTQDKLLSADADLRFSLPFMSAGGGTSATGNIRSETKSSNYSTALITDESYIPLPGAQAIASTVTKLLQLVPTEDNPTYTDGSSFPFKATLSGLPSNMCSAAIWTSSISSVLTAQPLNDGTCLFGTMLTPPVGTLAVFPVNFAIESVVPSVTPIKLTLSIPPTNIADLRQALALKPVRLDPIQAPGASPAKRVKISLRYIIAQQGSVVTVKGIDAANSSLTLNCGTQPTWPVEIISGSVSSSDKEETLLIDGELPSEPFADGTASLCQIVGKLDVKRNVGNRAGRQQIEAPTLSFQVLPAARPPAAPAL
jgi:hypothetical protein